MNKDLKFLQSFTSAPLMAASLIMLPTIAFSQGTSGMPTESKKPNLNGLWLGEGYTCNGSQPPEEVRIEQ
jgi:hypothetical protein